MVSTIDQSRIERHDIVRQSQHPPALPEEPTVAVPVFALSLRVVVPPAVELDDGLPRLRSARQSTRSASVIERRSVRAKSRCSGETRGGKVDTVSMTQ